MKRYPPTPFDNRFRSVNHVESRCYRTIRASRLPSRLLIARPLLCLLSNIPILLYLSLQMRYPALLHSFCCRRPSNWSKQLVTYHPARPTSTMVSELNNYETISQRAPFSTMPNSARRSLVNLRGPSSLARASKVGSPLRRIPPKRPAPPVPAFARSSTLQTADRDRRTLSVYSDPYGFYHPTALLDRSRYCPGYRPGMVLISHPSDFSLVPMINRKFVFILTVNL